MAGEGGGQSEENGQIIRTSWRRVEKWIGSCILSEVEVITAALH